MESTIEKILIDESAIQERVKELAKTISEDYKEKDLLLIGILKGALIFMGDLAKKIDIYCELDFMAVSSYAGGTSSSGIVKIIKDLDKSIQGRDVLIVEDIIDTGLTLSYLIDHFKTSKPNSVEIVCIFDKPYNRKAEIPVKYVGFEIPDEFIVGYGLDYDEKYRNLPYIGTLKREVYEK